MTGMETCPLALFVSPRPSCLVRSPLRPIWRSMFKKPWLCQWALGWSTLRWKTGFKVLEQLIWISSINTQVVHSEFNLCTMIMRSHHQWSLDWMTHHGNHRHTRYRCILHSIYLNFLLLQLKAYEWKSVTRWMSHRLQSIYPQQYTLLTLTKAMEVMTNTDAFVFVILRVKCHFQMTDFYFIFLF